MGWEIGIIMGFALGGVVSFEWRKSNVIKTAPEADLLVELKRRRLVRLLEEKAGQEVKKELES
jgi:hypothetical protein